MITRGYFIGEEYTEGHPYWRISFPWKSDTLHLTIDDYLRDCGASWKQVLVSLDFSMF